MVKLADTAACPLAFNRVPIGSRCRKACESDSRSEDLLIVTNPNDCTRITEQMKLGQLFFHDRIQYKFLGLYGKEYIKVERVRGIRAVMLISAESLTPELATELALEWERETARKQDRKAAREHLSCKSKAAIDQRRQERDIAQKRKLRAGLRRRLEIETKHKAKDDRERLRLSIEVEELTNSTPELRELMNEYTLGQLSRNDHA
jgi:hypothetical protein